MKLKFYYIGKDWDSTPLSVPSFKAYKYKDKTTKETTYYPINHKVHKNKTYIEGIGEVTLSKTKVVEIPTFSLECEEWQEYLDKYGQHCLYYSIEGKALNSKYYCDFNKRLEFYSLVKYGVSDYNKFVEKFLALNALQKEIILVKYYHYLHDLNCVTEDFEEWVKDYLFKPLYFTTDTIKYQPDMTQDCDIMLELYKVYRRAELQQSSKPYQQYQEAEKEYHDSLLELKGKFDVQLTTEELEKLFMVDKKKGELVDKAFNEISLQINDEVSGDNCVFPSTLKDRIKYLFGDEVLQCYNELIEEFVNS